MALVVLVVVIATLVKISHANLALEPFTFEDINNSTCPGWLAEYVQFHRDNMGKPDARYLIYICEKMYACGGLGDRLRGMKFALKVAYLSRRVFLIDDRRAVPLETLLQPNVLDWRPDNVTVDQASYARVFLMHTGHTVRHVGGGTHETVVDEVIFSDKRFVALHTNMPYDVIVRNTSHPMLQSDPPGDMSLNTKPHEVTTEGRRRASCLLRTLFRPHPDLVEEYKAQLRHLFNGSESVRYVAIHFRAGGMRGTENQPIQRASDNLSALVRSLACAQRNAEAYNITAPIVLLADNSALRTSVATGRLGTNVITTNFEAVHIDFLADVKDNKAKKQLLTTYVDMLLLIGAQCLVAPTRSGFNNQAALWGAHECFLGYVHKCFEMPVEAAVKTLFQLPHNW